MGARSGDLALNIILVDGRVHPGSTPTVVHPCTAHWYPPVMHAVAITTLVADVADMQFGVGLGEPLGSRVP